MNIQKMCTFRLNVHHYDSVTDCLIYQAKLGDSKSYELLTKTYIHCINLLSIGELVVIQSSSLPVDIKYEDGQSRYNCIYQCRFIPRNRHLYPVKIKHSAIT
jgi:hypothetical protein